MNEDPITEQKEQIPPNETPSLEDKKEEISISK